MSEAAAALVVAIIGAATGIVALAWNVLTWRGGGPRVELEAVDDQVMGTAWNTGRAPAHITAFHFQWTTPGSGVWIRFGTLSAATVNPGSITGEYANVPADGSVRFLITAQHEVEEAIRDGDIVYLIARTGRR